MYSNVQICPDLTPDVKCIRVIEYNQGRFIKRFHKHVAKHKLAKGRHWALLRNLVLRYEEAGADQIVDVYLTRRGKASRVAHRFRIVVDHPEPGVVRDYCGSDVSAWIDTVVVSDHFRRL